MEGIILHGGNSFQFYQGALPNNFGVLRTGPIACIAGANPQPFQLVSQINCCQWIQRRPKAALEFPTASSPLTI
jgi:hypothetical protein